MEQQKKTILFTLVLQTLSFILWFFPMFSISFKDESYQAMGRTITFIECFEGISGILIVFIILNLLAIAQLGIPIIKKETNTYHRFVMPKVSTILTLAIWLLPLSSVLRSAERYTSYGAKCGLTFGGWLFLIATVLASVMSFVLTAQSKKIKEKLEKERFHEEAVANKDPLKAPLPTGGWRCTCGRPHASYVSSCPCGISKKELNQ